MRFDNFNNKVEKNDFSDRPSFTEKKSLAKTNFSDREIDLIFGSIPDSVPQAEQKEEVAAPFDKSESREIYHQPEIQTSEIRREVDTPFIYQLHNKYILSQIKSGLMIIDQHAAHERVLYEKALKRFDANMPFSQQLLFPKTIDLDPARFAILKEINPFLSKLGFAVKFFGRNTIVIEGVPEDIKKGSEEKVLLDLIEDFTINYKEKKLEERESIAKSYSCKAAIKAGDYQNEKEMRLLIDQLFATTMPYVCPHGRPIVVKISLEEFDRRFGRT